MNFTTIKNSKDLISAWKDLKNDEQIMSQCPNAVRHLLDDMIDDTEEILNRIEGNTVNVPVINLMETISNKCFGGQELWR